MTKLSDGFRIGLIMRMIMFIFILLIFYFIMFLLFLFDGGFSCIYECWKEWLILF